MSDLVPLAAPEFEWDDWIDRSYWADNLDTIPEPLGSFDAGQSGVPDTQPQPWVCDNRITEQFQVRHIGLDEQTEAATVNVTNTYSQTPALAFTPGPSSSVLSNRTESNISVRSRLRTRGPALACAIPGCENLTFTRAYELSRHTRTKHGGSKLKPFACDAKGCFHKQSSCAFARPDKLTSHIKNSHRRETIFTRCPVKTCAFGPATLQAMGAHIRRAHNSDQGARAVLNASPCEVYRCPIWTCKKHMRVQQIPHHIESNHSAAEVFSTILELNADGFFVNQPSEAVGFTVSVWCPVCKFDCGTIKDFAEHLWTRHFLLSSADGARHFLNWKSELYRRVYKDSRSEVKKLNPWHDDQLRRLDPVMKTDTFHCPACSFSIFNVAFSRRSSEQVLILNHGLSLLRPENAVVAELYPYRFQILRLYPEFVTHPVFADLDPPRQQSMVWQGSA